MQNQNKVLLKQTLLLISISVLFFLLGSFASYDGPDPLAGYRIFYTYFFLTIIFFTPILALYYGLINNKNYVNLKMLIIPLKTFYWFLISAVFVFIFMMILFFSFFDRQDGSEPLAGYGTLYAYFVLAIIFLIPILAFYYGILKNKNIINLKWLNTVFNFFSWPLISTLLLIFIFGIYESFYMGWSEFGFFTNAWVSIKLIDMDEMVNFIYYTPALIMAGLLYWAVKINKTLDKI